MGGEARLIRGVGLAGLCALVINGVIGAGIFALPYALAQRAGGWTPLIILGIGLALLPLVFTFSRLSQMFDETGGPILYAEEAFGPTQGFAVGWLQFLSVAASTAANANALSDYLLGSKAGGTSELVHAIGTLSFLLLVLGLNFMPAKQTARFLVLASIAKLVPLVAIAVLAVPYLADAIANPAAAESWDPSQAILLACYAMIGFEGMLTMAGEARNPKRDMPRALVSMFLVCTMVYALVAAAYVATVYAPGKVDSAPIATMASAMLGPIGGMVALFAVGASILGNLVLVVLGNSRRLYAMQQQGNLPTWFGAIHQGSRIPGNAVLAVGVFVIALALSGGFVVLAVLSVAARLVVYLACAAALPVVRRRRGLPVTAVEKVAVGLSIALCGWLVLQSSVENWLGLALALAVGLALRHLTRRAGAMTA